ncbi:hypothetical protein [Reichenbachiella versicolor]|uniref:hypothetical protein n=1 Tax=Reichenbachiella versicolor TaxID=1821036 RepID=UPI000D6E7CD6|nr:hypothetical protein [Reichenbachiella versicolor]
MVRILISLLLIFTSWEIIAQSVYAPLSPDYYHIVDREEVLNKNFSPYLHSSYKPYRRSSIAASMDSIGRNSPNKDYIQTDNWEYVSDSLAISRKPFWKWFYRTKSDMLLVDQKDFMLKVSPVLYLSAGSDSNNESSPYINTRGLEMRGMIDDKIGFYTMVGENQAMFPSYVTDYIYTQGAVPNEAFWKKFGDDGGVDFFTARGYFTFQATRHIGIQFGHDKNFIGNGYRSLVLSDFSAPSTFLKLHTQIWRIQYTNLYTELVADAPWSSFGNNGTEAFPKKFMTAHHFSWNVTDNFNLGVFETIIFNRGDSIGSAFEWNYLNPIIFYRSIEQFTGSPDNALFGMDFKWNITKGVQLYGQGLLDEFSAAELKAGNGWWGNKYSIQLGGKYYNALGIDRLDLQGEYNMSRPFTYAHESIFTSFSHYNQPLAHPLGANFQELVGIVRYQPIKNLFLTAKAIYSDYGTDPVDSISYGGDPRKDYNIRLSEYDHSVGQGVANIQMMLDLNVSYMIKQNLFVDLRHIYRKRDSDDPSLDLTTNYTSLSFRLNIGLRDFGF